MNVNVIDMTAEQYEAAIPRWCKLQTMEQHMEILLCWGLAAGGPQSIGIDYCKRCEFCANGTKRRAACTGN